MKAVVVLLKSNVGKLLVKIFLFALSTVVLLTMVEFLAFPRFLKFQFFATSKTNYAVLFAGAYAETNTYVFCDNDILCYAGKDATQAFLTEVIMEKNETGSDNYIHQIYGQDLTEKEIVIPETLSKKHDVQKGDTIYLDVGYLVERTEYTVKDIIKDTPSVFGAPDRYITIVGYSQEYCESVNYHTVYLHTGMFNEIVLGSTYIKSIDFRSTASSELGIGIVFLLIYVAFAVVLSFFVLGSNDKETRKQLLKLRRMGCGLKKIMFFKILINSMTVMPIVIGPLIVMRIYKSAGLMLLTGSIVMLSMIIAFWVVDSINYKSIGGKDL